jgi:hypothetical protein
MPGEGLTHGPPAKKMQAAGTTGKADSTGIPCATVFTLIRSLPGAPGLLATIVRAALQRRRERDTSIGVSGRCDFTSASDRSSAPS